MNTETPYTIEQVKTLLEGITLGAWESFMRDSGEFNGYIVEATQGDRDDSCFISEVAKVQKHKLAKSREDADFIAAAPAIVRQLLAEREAMLARIDAMEERVKSEARSRAITFRDAPVATQRVYEMRGLLLEMIKEIRGNE